MARLNVLAMIAFFGFLFCQDSIAQKNTATPHKNSISLHYPVYNSFDGNSMILYYSPRKIRTRGYALELDYARFLQEKGAVGIRIGFGHLTYQLPKHLQISSREFLYLWVYRSFQLVKGPKFQSDIKLGVAGRLGSEELNIIVTGPRVYERYLVFANSAGVTAGFGGQFNINKNWFLTGGSLYTYYLYEFGLDKNSSLSKYLHTRHLLNLNLGLGFQF